jgi:glycerol transport system ATP-binding protein
MLGLSNLSRSLNGEPVLKQVTLDVPAGRPTALVGLSRAGRESTVRLLTGADRPQAGTITLKGADILRTRRDKGSVAKLGPAVPAPSGQRVSKMTGAEAAARAGLSDRLNAKLSELTPAERMRLAIAQAIAAKPNLLILDAPASQLPPESRDAFAEGLGQLVSGAPGVVILLAEGANEALGLAGDIVVLDGGAVIQSGPASEVSAHPFNLASAVATSWPQLNTLPMTVRDGRCLLSDGSRLQLPEGMLTPADGDCTLAFHPEDVTLERATPGCVRFVVRAVAEQVRGERRFLDVGFANSGWMCPLTTVAPHAGARLNAFVDRSHLLVFDAAGRAVG